MSASRRLLEIVLAVVLTVLPDRKKWSEPLHSSGQAQHMPGWQTRPERTFHVPSVAFCDEPETQSHSAEYRSPSTNCHKETGLI